MTAKAEKIRIDRWLWAARFFKTRSMASHAVSGGKVHVNGARIKPARPVNIGDELRIRRGEQEFTVIVLGLNDKRRPAKESQALYGETEESIAARESSQKEYHLQRAANLIYGPAKRPDKRERRQIRSFIRKKG